MPTYTYICPKGHRIDAVRKIADRDFPPDFCQECGSREFKRIQSGAPLVTLKGLGWHNRDYNNFGPRKGK